jgi:hypothetical protein
MLQNNTSSGGRFPDNLPHDISPHSHTPHGLLAPLTARPRDNSPQGQLAPPTFNILAHLILENCTMMKHLGEVFCIFARFALGNFFYYLALFKSSGIK